MGEDNPDICEKTRGSVWRNNDWDSVKGWESMCGVRAVLYNVSNAKIKSWAIIFHRLN